MADAILNSSAFNSDQQRVSLFKEYTHANTLSWLMGSGAMPIHLVLDFSKKEGSAIQIPFLNALSNKAVLGAAQLQGNTEDMSFVADSVAVDLVRHGVRVQGVDMSEQRAQFKVYDQAKPLLNIQLTQTLRDRFIDELGDLSEGDSQNRRLYGADDAHYNATEATALDLLTAADDKMSVAIIDETMEKARLGGNTSGVTKSHKIRPFLVEMDNGAIDDVFVMLLHPTAARQLRADPDFKNLALQRAENNSPKLVSGSRYMGNINGCLLYIVDEIDRLADGTAPDGGDYTRLDLTTAGTSNTAVVHNILLGAQAVAFAVASMPRFDIESTDFKRIQELAVTEIYGAEKLVFNSVDNGCIHVFSHAG